VSQVTIVLPPFSSPRTANCRYIDRCNRMFASGACSNCRFHSAGFDADGHRRGPEDGFNLVAINFSDAAR
jgi:hypothetical protein